MAAETRGYDKSWKKRSKNKILNLAIWKRFARGRFKGGKTDSRKAQEFIENIEKEKQGRLRKLNFWVNVIELDNI